MARSLARLILALLLLWGWSLPAVAAVEIAFYSREHSRNNYPHAFVTLVGTVDSSGEPVDTSFGFTARSVTPAILFGSVAGEVVVEDPRRVAQSDRQFSMRLSDGQYAAVLAVVGQWRERAQPSYNLNRRNCVHFVAELARTIGLRVEGAGGLMKKPRAFLQHVRSTNAGLLGSP